MADGELISLFKSIEVHAKRGTPEALFIAGMQNALGIGVKRNAIRGEQWLTRAAELGDPSAALMLGLFKWHGICFDRGVQQALHWLSEAYEEQFEELATLLRDVSSTAASAARERQNSVASERLSHSYSSQQLPFCDSSFAAAKHQVPQRPSYDERADFDNIANRTETTGAIENLSQLAEPRNAEQTPLGNQAANAVYAVNLPHNRGSSTFPEDDYNVVEGKAHRIGRKAGRACVKKAIRFNRLMARLADNFEAREIDILARKFAMRSGVLQYNILEGMETLEIPESESTPRLREIFVRAVKGAISDGVARSKRKAGRQNFFAG